MENFYDICVVFDTFSSHRSTFSAKELLLKAPLQTISKIIIHIYSILGPLMIMFLNYLIKLELQVIFYGLGINVQFCNHFPTDSLIFNVKQADSAFLHADFHS